MAEPRTDDELIDKPRPNDGDGVEDAREYDENTRGRGADEDSEDIDPDSAESDVERDDNVNG